MRTQALRLRVGRREIICSTVSHDDPRQKGNRLLVFLLFETIVTILQMSQLCGKRSPRPGRIVPP